MTAINLHIERIILDGIDLAPSDYHVLQTALQAELTRLLSNGSITDDLIGAGTVPHINAGTLTVTENSTPAEIGTLLAQTVYGVTGS
jgi:hypothetical protein